MHIMANQHFTWITVFVAAMLLFSSSVSIIISIYLQVNTVIVQNTHDISVISIACHSLQ